MYPVKKISSWDIKIDFSTDKPCELYVDNFPFSKKTTLRVLWVVEPNEVSGIKDQVIRRHKEYDLILTWNSEILVKCDNAVLYPHGMCWIHDFDLSKEKEYCVTSLIGGKQMSQNHLIRQKLPSVVDKITSIPLHLFNSRNNPFNGNGMNRQMHNETYKNELFYSQFHIAIENVSQSNYFSEKLIDCFQTKTVPIYLGCPNIGDFYDTRGMIIVNSLDEMVEKINSISPDTYNSMLDYVEKNYLLSEPHANFRETLKNTIIKFVEQKQKMDSINTIHN